VEVLIALHCIHSAFDQTHKKVPIRRIIVLIFDNNKARKFHSQQLQHQKQNQYHEEQNDFVEFVEGGFDLGDLTQPSQPRVRRSYFVRSRHCILRNLPNCMQYGIRLLHGCCGFSCGNYRSCWMVRMVDFGARGLQCRARSMHGDLCCNCSGDVRCPRTLRALISSHQYLLERVVTIET